MSVWQGVAMDFLKYHSARHAWSFYALEADPCEPVKTNPKRQKMNQVTILRSTNQTQNGPISRIESKFYKKVR
jgi:hypothetical protein